MARDILGLGGPDAHVKNLESTPADRLEQVQVVAIEQVETAVAPPLVLHPLGDLLQPLDPRRRVVERPEEFQVTAVRGLEQPHQIGEAVDRLLHRRQLHLPRPVTMFHPGGGA